MINDNSLVIYLVINDDYRLVHSGLFVVIHDGS